VRGLGRSSGNDLVLAVRPGWTHSVVLKISVVSGFEVYEPETAPITLSKTHCRLGKSAFD
jgi:hypothetical protein